MAPRKIEPEEITADIRRVAKLLGRGPRSDEYREHGRFNHSAPARAVEAAGLVYQGNVIDPFADLRKVAETLGRIPSCKEYEAHASVVACVSKRSNY